MKQCTVKNESSSGIKEIPIKLRDGSIIKRIGLNNDIKYNALLAVIRETMRYDSFRKLDLYYTDDVGDIISLDDDYGLHEAIIITRCPINILDITIKYHDDMSDNENIEYSPRLLIQLLETMIYLICGFLSTLFIRLFLPLVPLICLYFLDKILAILEYYILYEPGGSIQVVVLLHAICSITKMIITIATLLIMFITIATVMTNKPIDIMKNCICEVLNKILMHYYFL